MFPHQNNEEETQQITKEKSSYKVFIYKKKMAVINIDLVEVDIVCSRCTLQNKTDLCLDGWDR